jgi:hypothetical protein
MRLKILLFASLLSLNLFSDVERIRGDLFPAVCEYQVLAVEGNNDFFQLVVERSQSSTVFVFLTDVLSKSGEKTKKKSLLQFNLLQKYVDEFHKKAHFVSMDISDSSEFGLENRDLVWRTIAQTYNVDELTLDLPAVLFFSEGRLQPTFLFPGIGKNFVLPKLPFPLAASVFSKNVVNGILLSFHKSKLFI